MLGFFGGGVLGGFGCFHLVGHVDELHGVDVLGAAVHEVLLGELGVQEVGQLVFYGIEGFAVKVVRLRGQLVGA